MFFLNILLLLACASAPQILANNQNQGPKPFAFSVTRAQQPKQIIFIPPTGFSGNVQKTTCGAGQDSCLSFYDQEGAAFIQQASQPIMLANNPVDVISARQIPIQAIGAQSSEAIQAQDANICVLALIQQGQFAFIEYLARNLQASRLFLAFNKPATAELVRQLNQNTSNASIISILTDLIARTPRYRLACISRKRQTSFDTATLRELLRIAANNTNLGFFKNLLESRLTNAKYGCLFRD